ncbi:unnamed protein product [Cuscuta campestris]|uniref:Uncharacterized protein n=1 Tax=Cuscuta campestris TaxID=132261 RepID=A0A484MKK8_9ASTE|nr:unnamed protein product [Cuscuta campestris]
MRGWGEGTRSPNMWVRARAVPTCGIGAQVLAGGSSGLCSVEKSRCDGVTRTKTKTKKEDLQVVPCVESFPDERRSGGASREVIVTAVQDDLADQMV